MVYELNRSAVIDPPLQASLPKMSEKCGRFSNFEFSLEQYLDIIKRNISAKFYENPT